MSNDHTKRRLASAKHFLCRCRAGSVGTWVHLEGGYVEFGAKALESTDEEMSTLRHAMYVQAAKQALTRLVKMPTPSFAADVRREMQEGRVSFTEIGITESDFQILEDRSHEQAARNILEKLRAGKIPKNIYGVQNWKEFQKMELVIHCGNAMKSIEEIGTSFEELGKL